MDYEVKLEIFEGPMDLLLHLIYKNEVDIFDIPIATITDQYLEYIDMMKAFNIDIAGDFFLMASTLIHIKSRMLLPESKDEEEDPRMEITRPLLEYLRFKEAAGELFEREVLERDVFARKTTAELRDYLDEEDGQLDVNLFQLMEAFKKVIEQQLPGVQMKLQLEKWSVKAKTEELIEFLKERGPVLFQEFFEGHCTVSEFIVTFLALLELAHIGLIKVFQATPGGDVKLIPSFEENGENDDE